MMGEELNTQTNLSGKLKTYRRINGLSQEGLAEVSGISIRTIQRIEKGLSVGSAFTLGALAKALHVNTTDLMPEVRVDHNIATAKNKLKLLNLSAICVILIPLSNIIIPAFVLWKHRNNEVINTLGRRILSFHVLWLLITVLMMITVPLILLFLFEPLRGGRIPLPVPVYFISVILNVCFIVRFAWGINNRPDMIENLPNIL